MDARTLTLRQLHHHRVRFKFIPVPFTMREELQQAICSLFNLHLAFPPITHILQAELLGETFCLKKPPAKTPNLLTRMSLLLQT